MSLQVHSGRSFRKEIFRCCFFTQEGQSSSVAGFGSWTQPTGVGAQLTAVDGQPTLVDDQLQLLAGWRSAQVRADGTQADFFSLAQKGRPWIRF